MGKRSFRLSVDELVKRGHQLQGHLLHVVLKDGRTFAGTLLKINDENVYLAGRGAFMLNKRKHSHQIPLKQVLEAIYDQVSEY